MIILETRDAGQPDDDLKTEETKQSPMEQIDYKPKIDWWVYLVLIIMVGGSILGLLYESVPIGAAILGSAMLLLWLFAVTGVKYEIRGNRLGIRNFYRWTWIPIDNIQSVGMVTGLFVQGPVSATLSRDMVRIELSDKAVFKSAMPIHISPADRDGFIFSLKELNPDITVKHY